MSIEAFQIASAVFGAASVGLANLSYGLHRKLKESEQHVSGLQKYVQDQCVREGALIRERDELNAIVTKVHNQRQRALLRATEVNRAKAEAKADVKAKATEKTLSELKMHPLRSRAEVVADVRAAQGSSAG